jgi:hypothetical protein
MQAQNVLEVLLCKLCSSSFLQYWDFLLLSLVRTDFANIRHDLGGILGDLLKVSGGNCGLVKEWSDQTDGRGTILQEFTRVVQVDTRSGVDGEERQGRAHSLDPTWSTGDAGEKFLKRSSVTVGVHEFRGSLTSRNRDNVTFLAPFNDIGKHDGRNDELTTCVNSSFGVFNSENSSASDHDVAVVLLTKVSEVIETVGSCESELADLETSINGGLHGLGASVGGRRAEDGARPNLGELVKDGFVVFDALHAIESAGSHCRREESV